MSYQERVEKAASQVVGFMALGMNPHKACERFVNALEMRLPENSHGRRDFIADVVRRAKVEKAVSDRVPKVRIAGRTFTKSEADQLLAWVWSAAMEEWGRCFPDCDPSDRLIPRVARRAGVERDRAIEIVDRAMQHSEGVDWSAWQERSWEEIVSDMDCTTRECMFGTSDPENPWKSR